MRILVLSFLFLIAQALGPQVASASERRVALVLGNGNYTSAVKLPNPASDAEAMAALLKTKGFEVVLGTNLAREAMAEKLSDFAKLAGGADVALFYYAGHGMQLSGRNYLVPVDAILKSEFDVKVRTIDIEAVLQDTMADAKIKLVLLDACRDNPFAQQIQASAPKTRSIVMGSGLAEMKPGEGTLIAFATGPGQVAIDGEGKHSPFTRALIKHLDAPDLEIRHALTQVRAQVADETRKQQLPWENTNLTGYFYMAKAEVAPTAAVPASTAPSVASTDHRAAMELELWSSVKSSKSADEYRAYLEKFPNGTFADLARSRVAALSSGSSDGSRGAVSGDTDIKNAEASTATEDALGLDPAAWSDVQTRLTALGYSTRGTDGRVGDGTRRAINQWQSARGYQSSGYLNRLQREALLREPLPATPPKTASRDDDGDSTPKRRSGGGGGGGGRSAGDAAAAAVAGAIAGTIIQGAARKIRLPF